VASSSSVSDWLLSQPDPAAALAHLALKLDAANAGGDLGSSEKRLVTTASSAAAPPRPVVSVARSQLRAGADPLGDAFCLIRSGRDRRDAGAVYTPSLMVEPMVEWAMQSDPTRLIDPGCGSGRFVLDVARRRPSVELVAIDLDPLATLMTRAGLAVLERSDARVLNRDFTTCRLPAHRGRTAYVGNPPYVRHHNLPAATKIWAQRTAASLGLSVSGLAGLHAYFFLAVASKAKAGDVGCFVTSAEWLDVNYGAIVRRLLLNHLGGEAVHVMEPESMPFENTATTAAISCFRVAKTQPSMRFRPVSTLQDIPPLEGTGDPVLRDRLSEVHRWSTFVRTRNAIPEGYIELGELCRVHRGTVTGSNRTWVTTAEQSGLPTSVLTPTVTRARELFSAGEELATAEGLRRVVDLPVDLDELDEAERRKVDAFLKRAKKLGVHTGYIASHRSAWWSVGLRRPAPILATYMARRPPAFVRNLAEARHINIAHGLYPRQDIPQQALDKLADSLRRSITLAQGRTYAGGLTKFEPKEMERLHVPSLEVLMAT
jgi:adenine-specific DNA-methyltransferase